jgi:hypothetical protein
MAAANSRFGVFFKRSLHGLGSRLTVKWIGQLANHAAAADFPGGVFGREDNVCESARRVSS